MTTPDTLPPRHATGGQPGDGGLPDAALLDAAAASGVLPELADHLARLGFHEYASSFNPVSPSFAPHRRHLAEAPATLRPALELFLLGDEVPGTDLARAAGAAGAALVDLRLLRVTPAGMLATPGLVVRHLAGYWLLTERPGPTPTFWFGEDSVALLCRSAVPPGGRALDLCSGPGIQALHASSFADEVLATEIDPAAASLGRANAAMNRRAGRISVRCGDLYAPVLGETFDAVVANPPFLPVPDDLPYPVVGHGGADGLHVARRIVLGLPAALRAGGRAQLVATCLGDDRRPLWSGELAGWCAETGFDVTLTLVSAAPFRPGALLFEGIARPVADRTGLSRDEVVAAFTRSCAAQGATRILSCFLYARHGAGRLEVIDLSAGERTTMWYVEPARRPEWLRPRALAAARGGRA